MCKYILLWFFTTFYCGLANSNRAGESRGLRSTDPCTEMQRLYIQKGLNISVPRSAISGNSLRICHRSYTCCTPEMEDQMHSQSVIDFEKKVTNKSALIQSHLSIKHREFNDLFIQLIETAKKSLDALFEATYDEKYKENAVIFMKLFDDLMEYYKGTALDINDIFDDFFVNVMQGVFKLLYPSFVIDEEYNQCMADNMHKIRPFDDTPEILASQVKRAFVAARTFVKGLDKGRHVAGEIAKVYPTTQCAKGLTKMSYCSKCQGYTILKPCRNMCLNVMKGCLCDISDINQSWDRYITQMSLVLDRLEKPFNIKSLLDQMDVKISSAIMKPQDNKKDFTEKVMKSCGELKEDPNYEPYDFQSYPNYSNNRRSRKGGRGVNEEKSNINKRSVDEKMEGDRDFHKDFDSFDPKYLEKLMKRGRRKNQRKFRERNSSPYYDNSRRYSMHPFSGGYAETKSNPLDDLIKSMKDTLKVSKNYWKNLPSSVCDEEAEDDVNKCWNGEVKGRYSQEVTSDGFRNQANNPEVSVDANREPDLIIRQQNAILNEVVAELKHAYRGIDPSLIDSEDLDVGFEDDEEISGYFSGEGSGYEQQSSNSRKKEDIRHQKPFSIDINKFKGKVFKDLRKREREFIQKLFKDEIIYPDFPLEDLKEKLKNHPDYQNQNPTVKNPGGYASNIYGNQAIILILAYITCLVMG